MFILAKLSKKFTKNSGKIFAVSSKTAMLTEDSEQNPIMEEKVLTYKINRDHRNKFVITQLPRKGKPRRVKTIPAKKGQLMQDIIRDIQEGRIVFKTQHREKQRRYSTITKDGQTKVQDHGETSVLQTNYLARVTLRFDGATKRVPPQMVGLVRVTDTSTNISDHFVGYSKKMRSSRPDMSDLAQAEIEVKMMAIGKFLDKHESHKFTKANYKRALDFFEVDIIEKRFQYYEIKSF